LNLPVFRWNVSLQWWKSPGFSPEKMLRNVAVDPVGDLEIKAAKTRTDFVIGFAFKAT
jgi:hypothetical protein